MATTAELVAKFRKTYGAAVVDYGAKLKECLRIPTGLFALDLATGGGFPRGRASIVFGPESSGKTSVSLKAIAQHQKLWPELTCVFVDIENSLEPAWATQLGVDMSKLLVVKPDFAEQAIDMVESFLYAADIGLVVVDSLAALITTNEAEKSAEGAVVGGSALAIGKLVRKSTLAFRAAEKEGRYPTLIYINQTRFKIGVMHGNPEDMPGGNGPKFQSALTLRCYGKNVIDNKVSKTMPVRKHTSVVVRKWKVPIVATNCEYEMVTIPHDGLEVGQVDDWNLIAAYLKDYGLLTKDKGGWTFDGTAYPTQTALREKAASDPLFNLYLKDKVVGAVVAEGLPEPKAEDAV